MTQSMEIDTGKLDRLFFSGIGGSGMSALAQLLAGQGKKVSGSDRKNDRGESATLFAALTRQGIELFPQDGSGVRPELDAVVVSTAVESDVPDYRRAGELGIPIIARPQLLAALVNSRRGFCVAGTSGKSTVTALTAYVMARAGLAPNFIGGAAVANWTDRPGTGNALGGKSGIYVVEACESDGSITGYRPAVGAILNIQR
ncbi:MAG: Mur ligase domain-containing protein, partial [Candidatus Glassbacteria bacterium]